MKSSALIAVALLLALVSSSLGLGTLWVNNIRGNSDTNTVVVEEVIIDDNTVYVDFINGLGASLVTIEEVEFFEGNVRVPVDLLVEQVATIQGLLNANGGILADDEVEGGFSFKVEDNSGITTIKRGELRPDGGINVDDLKFEVKPSGETTIAEAPLRPNGGINSNNGQFTVSADDGSVLTEGDLKVELDIIIGTNQLEDRSIRRVPTDDRIGGNTILSGQSSLFRGGDLVLLPGYATLFGDPGNIVFGRQEPDPLLITRAASGQQRGGRTTFAGQSSTGGRGGDVQIQAGSTTNLDSSGGNVVLSPGLPGEGGLVGDIVLGTDEQEYVGYDLTIRRPILGRDNFANASSTYFDGQSSQAGSGGSLYFRAGSVLTAGNPFRGGNLVLEPGYGNSEAGFIYIGRPEADDLTVARLAVDESGASTVFRGQDSNAGNGGKLVLEAGDARTNGNGGDLWLTPGHSANGGQPGEIVWGSEDEDLVVRRPSGGDQATTTTFAGQDGNFVGGDLVLRSGASIGNADSGSIRIYTPAVSGGDSGSIAIFSGDAVEQAGNLYLNAGSTSSGALPGGNVEINGGGSGGGNGGSVFLRAGLGATVNGEVIVQQADRLLVDEVDVVIRNGVLEINDGTNTVVLSPDPENILTYNGDRLLTARRGAVISPLSLFPLGGAEEEELLLNLSEELNLLIRELSQCGHGMISVVDEDGVIIPDSDPYCTGNRRRNINELNIANLQNYDITCHSSQTLLPEDQSCLMGDAAIMGDALADKVITSG